MEQNFDNKNNKDSKNQLQIIHNDIADLQKNIGLLLTVQKDGKWLGLNSPTLKRHRCGYCSTWLPPQNRDAGTTVKFSRRVIIPTTNHYLAVMLNENRTEENKMHVGKIETFGAEFVPDNADLILVVNDEIDAMSIYQATQGRINVIATSDAAEYKNAVNFLQDKFYFSKPKVLILFAPDAAGRLNAPILRDELFKTGFPATFKFLSDENSKITANDILREQGDEQLAVTIYNIVDDAQKDFSAAEMELTLIKNSAQSDSLEIALREINKKIADFDKEKSNAIEKLNSVISFDRDSVFADDILNAAAFAKLYSVKTYSAFKADIQNQNKRDSFLLEWRGEVKGKAADVKSREIELLTRRNEIQAKITSTKFISQYDDLKNFIIPEGYSVSENGVKKVVGERLVDVCDEAITITKIFENYEEETFKIILAHFTQGKWRNLPTQDADVIANRRKIIDLARYDFPVADHNALLIIEYLYKFKIANKAKFEFSFTVPRCGWHTIKGQEIFVDPRRNCAVDADEKNISVVVDNSSTFAKSLKSVGSINEWRMAYEIAKKSPIARLIVAASVAPPLLKILGERNFLLYVHAPTRAGKTTAAYLGASAIGDEKIIRSFDATKNGLIGAAYDVSDNAFIVDEKQAADGSLKERIANLIYSLANGVGRTKLNKDSSLKNLQDWRTIAIMTGETPLVDDNVTGGVYSRLLSIRAPKTILSSDDCREIRQIIKKNYGLVLPLVLDKIFEYGTDKLREQYKYLVRSYSESCPAILPEYVRYMVVLVIADTFLNFALNPNDPDKTIFEDFAISSYYEFPRAIIPFFMTRDEIADTPREKDFVLGFLAAHAAHFECSDTYDKTKGREVYGRFGDDFVYITVAALRQACKSDDYDFKKVVADLIEDKFFIPNDKIAKDRKSVSPLVVKKINGVSTRCYRIPRNFIDAQ